MQILDFLTRKGYEFSGRGRFRRCVQHDSLVVDTVRNAFHWNSRSISGGPLQWLTKVEGFSPDEALDQVGEKPGYCPPRPKPKKEDGATPEQLASLTSRAELYHESLTPEARAYWHSQGIDDASIDHFKLGYIARRSFKPYCEAYPIPYWHKGQVINLRQRLADESQGRYRGEFAGLGNHLFNIDGLSRKDGLMRWGQAVLFEGEKKAIVGHQVGFRVAGIAGANTWQASYVEHFKAAGIYLVYIALDPGVEPHVTEQIARDFAAAGIRAFISKLPDKPDDMINQGVTAGELLAIIRGQKPYKLSAEACARRDQIRAEEQSRRERLWAENQQRLIQQLEADIGPASVSPGHELIDPKEVKELRDLHTSSRTWRDYCRERWPELDAEEQSRIKLEENREQRLALCGEIHKRTLADGQVSVVKWNCGLCDRCLSMQAALYRRALNEIQGIINPGEIGADLKEALQAEAEALGLISSKGEPAPPLARVHGPLSLVTVEEPDRVKFSRTLRRKGIRYRSLPVEKDGRLVYDYLVNSDEWGDPLGPMATEERLKRWTRGFRGKRASGDLLPSLRDLEARYREPLRYEVILPELDDDDQLVDEDIFYIDLPDIGTQARLPEIAVDFEVKDRASLQAALLFIHEEQVKILSRRRGRVIYGVGNPKRFYTRYSTFSALLAEFNAANEAVKARQLAGKRPHVTTRPTQGRLLAEGAI